MCSPTQTYMHTHTHTSTHTHMYTHTHVHTHTHAHKRTCTRTHMCTHTHTRAHTHTHTHAHTHTRTHIHTHIYMYAAFSLFLQLNGAEGVGGNPPPHLLSEQHPCGVVNIGMMLRNISPHEPVKNTLLDQPNTSSIRNPAEPETIDSLSLKTESDYLYCG